MITFIRLLFILGGVLSAVFVFYDSSLTVLFIASGAAFLVSLAIVIVSEYIIHTFRVKSVFFSLMGLLVGLVIGHLMASGVASMPLVGQTSYGGLIEQFL